MSSRNGSPWCVVCSMCVVAAGLGGLAAGCDEQSPSAAPSAAPTEDPCAKSCAMHSKCVLDLRENLIRTVLEGSGDDVKKTALGYAKQDATELDARCRKVCAATPEATKKMGGCATPSCVQLVSCLADSLPEEAGAEDGPHSCVVEALSQCIEYTGAKLKTSDVKPACRALFEGKYVKSACAEADRVASCEVGKGKPGERTNYYYSTGKKPHTAESAKAACVGDFKPATTGDGGVAADASASPAATTTPIVGVGQSPN